MVVPFYLRCVFVAVLAGLMVVAPVLYYRHSYTHSKRLREVYPGQVYRSGCMTEPGFRAALTRYKIRTVVNLQEEAPDPELARGYFGGSSYRESELCRELGVKYLFLQVDLLSPWRVPPERPKAIDRFLKLLDDPNNYPILVHCRAGLHRTGILMAVYRMEFHGWTPVQALAELKEHGFGTKNSTVRNEYIRQYVTTYTPGIRDHRSETTAQAPGTIDSNERMRQLMVWSERTGPPQDGHWTHHWLSDNPSHLTPVPIHGGVMPGF